MDNEQEGSKVTEEVTPEEPAPGEVAAEVTPEAVASEEATEEPAPQEPAPQEAAVEVTPEEVAPETEQETPVSLVPILTLRPGGNFVYGGENYELVSLVALVKNVGTGVFGNIDPSVLVEKT